MIQWECPVYAAKGISLRMIRTTVEMVRNVSYDRLEALIYFSDITENYFSELDYRICCTERILTE